MTENENATDSDIALQIGKNIRFFRKVKGITIKELADIVSEKSGQPVSGTSVGYWERGKKNISALQLHYVADALDIKEQTLYNLGDFNGVEAEGSFANMLNFALQWKGNRKALVQFVRLYMCLNKKDRADVAGMGIEHYYTAKIYGKLEDNAPDIDIKYLENEWLKLMR